MTSSRLTRYGLLGIGFLVLGNIAIRQGAEPAADVGQDRIVRPTAAIPAWLKASSASTESEVDLFRLQRPNATSSQVAAQVQPKHEETVAAKGAKLAGAAMPSAATPVSVLAITRSGEGMSALVEFRGKARVVFPGDVIDEQYQVIRIADGTVWLESL